MTMTERTPIEIIAAQRVHGVQVAYRAEYFVKALADAGYVIVQKPIGAELFRQSVANGEDVHK